MGATGGPKRFIIIKGKKVPLQTGGTSYRAVAAEVARALRESFGPQALVETEPAPGDTLGKKVFVLVVSSKLNGKTVEQKQRIVWRVIREALDGRESRVSVAIARGTDELW